MSDIPSQYEKKRLEEYTQKLKKELRELFQIGDAADLDFGMYRVMHQKRQEVENFIEHKLVKTVDEAFGSETQVSISDQFKADIFAHITEFFLRYYKDGDFLSLPRYSRKEKYAIPYNGEEVYLYWANRDQHYIKTDLYLNNYAFDVGIYKVSFEICKDISDTSNKEQNLYFILKTGDNAVSYAPEDKVLTIHFERISWDAEKYGQLLPEGSNKDKPSKQDICTLLSNQIISKINEPVLIEALTHPAHLDKPEDSNTILKKHLYQFTEENKSDFFIHKNLRGFLTQQLDFYIKNELVNIDDLGTENESPVNNLDQYMSKVRIFKLICLRVIDFLSQMEDFQKTLYEKKKFVLGTDYCMTIDYVPEDFYSDIITNKKQLNEWRALYGAGEEKQASIGITSRGISLEYLKSHPHLVLDTKFFDESFKERLLSKLHRPDGTPILDLDDELGGLMIHSENWQALNLLEEKYRTQIKSIYIDPPYNTGSDDFLYKDNYMHSSWLTMMYERIALAKTLMSESSIISASIDDNEIHRLGLVFNDIFGENQRAACAPWLSEPSGGKDKSGLRAGHEYLLIYHNGNLSEISQDEISNGELNLKDKWGPYRKGRELRKWGAASLRKDRPQEFYPLIAPDRTEVYPIRNDGKEGRWRWGKDNPQIIKALEDPEYLHWEKTPFDNGVIINGMHERWDPFEKIRSEKRATGWSTWLDSMGINADATRTLKELFGTKNFDTPKPVQLIKWFVNLHDDHNGIAMDFFAGSGVLAHAVLDLNEEDEYNRKYILVEMDDYFHTVMKPRIEKVMFASEWKAGKPVQGSIGQSHIFKYQTLEQYEDTLDNIVFHEKYGTIQKTFDTFSDYMLQYMLDFETRSSPCRVNVDMFKKPFDYTLRIRRKNIDKDHLRCLHADNENYKWDVKVDLVETFNYLLGLRTKSIAAYDANDTHYRVINGTTSDGSAATIIWRDCSSPKFNLVSDEKFIKDTIIPAYSAKTVYINGQFFMKGAMPIESKFRELMGA